MRERTARHADRAIPDSGATREQEPPQSLPDPGPADLLGAELEKRSQVRGCDERVGERGATGEGERRDEATVDLGHDERAVREWSRAQRGEPCERLPVGDPVEAQEQVGGVVEGARGAYGRPRSGLGGLRRLGCAPHRLHSLVCEPEVDAGVHVLLLRVGDPAAGEGLRRRVEDYTAAGSGSGLMTTVSATGMISVTGRSASDACLRIASTLVAW